MTRWTLAAEPRCPTQFLERLAKDDDWGVRAAVAGHPAITDELRSRLTRDRSAGVSAAGRTRRRARQLSDRHAGRRGPAAGDAMTFVASGPTSTAATRPSASRCSPRAPRLRAGSSLSLIGPACLKKSQRSRVASSPQSRKARGDLVLGRHLHGHHPA